jgi:hypothetical protein
MKIIFFEHYAGKRKTTIKPRKSSNDNDPKWTAHRLTYFSKTGENLVPGERGQVLVVETHRCRSCSEF